MYSDKKITQEIQKAFISSYVKMISGKKLTKSNSEEVLEVTPISENTIKLKPFVRVKTDYDGLFQKFIDSDAFGWMFFKQKEHLFLRSPDRWLKKNELKDHRHAKFAIYYLLDTKNDAIYIGSAIDLFTRLKGKRSEIPHWDKFRYEVLKPEFSKFLHRIEYHTIRSYASILRNKLKIPSLKLSKIKLVNKTVHRP